mgnify:CR=1 FL=1
MKKIICVLLAASLLVLQDAAAAIPVLLMEMALLRLSL